MKRKRQPEETIYGLHACEAAAQARPHAIIRMALTEALVPHFSDLLKELARRKRGYHIVQEDELTRMTSSVHHGGVSMVLEKRERVPLHEWAHRLTGPALAVALLGVENPHNVGAIARSATHFGAKALILLDEQPGMISGSTYRVARGALEHLSLVSTERAKLFDAQEFGFELVALSPRGGEPLQESKPRAKSILLLGAEETGLPNELERKANRTISIAGTGIVESLNVSTAAAIALYHWRKEEVG